MSEEKESEKREKENAEKELARKKRIKQSFDKAVKANGKVLEKLSKH